MVGCSPSVLSFESRANDNGCPHRHGAHPRVLPIRPPSASVPRARLREGEPRVRAHPGHTRALGLGDGVARGMHGGCGWLGERLCGAVEGGRAIPVRPVDFRAGGG